MIGVTFGNYRVAAKLGAGGMGAVYLAEHLLIGRKVAVKVLLPELSHNEELVSRFFNEARSTATLAHPGLVDVFDFGFLPDGSAYLVMEYLEGEPLARRLSREGATPLPVLWTVGRQIASAVHAAHERGIVHRDLKPDNVFLVPDPEQPQGLRVKVLDFGIAKLTGDDGASGSAKTRTGAVMGTPTYMSPEQCRGAGQVDRRSDVYSLGCILFEMACGQPPFVRQGVGELIAAHMLEPPPLPSSIEPSLSPTLEGLILDMLAKEPDARPQTMERVREALDLLVTGVPLQTPAYGSAVSHRSHPALASPTTLAGEVPAGPRRGKGLWLGLGAVAVIAAVVVVMVVVRPFSSRSQATRDSPPAHVATPPRPDASRPPPRPDTQARRVPPPRPRLVHLRVDSDPSGAEVYRAADGLLVGQTPYTQAEPPAHGKAVFLLKLAGHHDRRVLLDASRDNAVKVKLTPLARPRPIRIVARRAAPEPRGVPVRRPPAMRPIRDGVADPFGN